MYNICMDNLLNNVATYVKELPYSTKQWRGKTLANQSFQSFGKELMKNVGEFKLLTFS